MGFLTKLRTHHQRMGNFDIKTSPSQPTNQRLLVGLWLSLNVLSFQTSLETWTTAAIINWLFVSLFIDSPINGCQGCPCLVLRLLFSVLTFFLASVRLGHKSLRTLMKRSSSWYLPGTHNRR